MEKKVSLEEMKAILKKMIDEAKPGYQESEWYKPLRKLGLLGEYDSILIDSYFDEEAVEFAYNVLNKIEPAKGLSEDMKRKVREALIYALWTGIPGNISARRVILSDFYHSLNRKNVLSNRETGEEVKRGYKYLEALEECSRELGRGWGLDSCVAEKLKGEEWFKS